MMRRKTCQAGAILALLIALALPSTAAAAFEFSGFSGSLTTAGAPSLQAGAHPDLTTRIEFRTKPVEGTTKSTPDENVREIDAVGPPGLVGDPTGLPRCSFAELQGTGPAPVCAPEAQAGRIYVVFGSGVPPQPFPLYNLVPPLGSPAEFGANVAGVLVFIDAKLVNRDGTYSLALESHNVSEGLTIFSVRVELWGVPASPSHDAQRSQRGGKVTGAVQSTAPVLPFLTNPTSCPGTPLTFSATASSWQGGSSTAIPFSADEAGNPLVISGCEGLPFEGSLSVRPTTQAAASPTGLEAILRIPQVQAPTGTSVSNLKSAVVTLPEGLTVNPSSAQGLGSCSESQINLEGEGAATCPDASKIGSVSIDTPILEEPLEGGVYLAQQGENKFGSLLAIYIAVDDPLTGTVLKLPGKVETTASGRLTVSFEDAPQLPFETLRLELFGGPRASLMTPPSCGSYSSSGVLTPWSGAAPVTVSDSFAITSGPGGSACPQGAFGPKLSAGTANPVANAFSPLRLTLSRDDGTQVLGGLTVELPEGLLASLSGIPYCADAQIASISSAEGSGATQLSAPACPAASRVGSVAAAAGAGATPFHLGTGSAYLAGPYKGAPLSLAVVVPAVAGPFDLGTVVVRAALRVDRETARVTAVSDPFPTALFGIPLDVREIDVNLDRPSFTVNPTDCEASRFQGTATAPSGAVAPISDRFQVDGCRALAFAPSLSLKLDGGTRRAAYPRLTAVVHSRPGEANLSRVSVALPHTEFLAQNHIRTVCTRVQFAASQCPAGSIYGYAEANTPLLDHPLSGPVYLRSSSHKLPDLVASLHGQIDIDLAGRIDSIKGGIRATFTGIPDASIRSFTLRMSGGKKGLLQNSAYLCKTVNRATVAADGQNGAAHDSHPRVLDSCPGRKAAGKHGKPVGSLLFDGSQTKVR